jgi:light-regulated signal transduction histidine kinase (bacteriophytochrome)
MREVSVADLDRCAAEPIRIPGSIQPHGALLVLEPDGWRVIQASANCREAIGFAFDPEAAATFGDLPFATAALKSELAAWRDGVAPVYLRTVTLGATTKQLLCHRTRQGLILEIEDAPASEHETLEALYPRLRWFLDRIGPASDLATLGHLATRQIRELTGFDRVLLYQFDPDWNGTVVAEDSNGALPSCLDLRFPASDIPAQARELYRLNRLRLIPDADYRPVPLVPPLSPVDGMPLDLGQAALRSVSPIHLEYMRNMGTWASMSISILIDGALWGLISCHNRTPRRTNAQIRAACDMLGQILALQIGANDRLAQASERVELKRVDAELLAHLSHERDFVDGLARHPRTWMSLARATGAAVLSNDRVETAGKTPPEPALRALAAWLGEQKIDGVYATEALADQWPPAAELQDVAAGLVAVPISELHPSFVMWFRPEVVRTVKWSGDPRKPTGAERISPRHSFEAWKQLVEHHAVPWRPAEIEAARDFRASIINVILRRAEERAALAEELERSNKELEAFSYSVSHDLRAPFRHIAGYAELLTERARDLDDKSRHYLRSIVDAALSAGRLVDDLLRFSHLGRTNLAETRIDMAKLADEVVRSLANDIGDRPVEWRIGQLPPAWGDPSMIRQVLFNLVANAVKYSRMRSPAIIRIEGRTLDDATEYSVADNGVGFDMAYADKLFGVFQRLHRVEDFEGTGIGLALCRRIVDRHGGRIAADGALDQGATFTFVLPKRKKENFVGGP